MMRSMFSGVSGLRAHQIKMDVIGNNIANVNTVGFKSSRVTFQEIYSQTLKAASAPGGGRGGVNPQQVGLGVAVASVDVLHEGRNVQRTDNPKDLAIEGDGFFIVSDGTSNRYTRAGNFDIDTNGYLVFPGGLYVLGWTEKQNGEIDTSAVPGRINLTNIVMPAQATDYIEFQGNLDANLEIGKEVPYSLTVFDSQGGEHQLTVNFTKTAANTWDLSFIVPEGYTINGMGYPGVVNYGTLRFDNAGKLVSVTPDTGLTSIDIVTPDPGVDVITLQATNFDINNPPVQQNGIRFDLEKFTQTKDPSTVKVVDVSGHRAGTLDAISFDNFGRVIGTFSNGRIDTVAEIAIARFSNPAGLAKVANNLYQNTSNSGEPLIGRAGVDGRGTINPGALEMSNVDLSKEFTEMIITQRGFQANSRIITTSDEMLQELVNLKR
ncbi:MAG TPA: flagellar hook protein FlgE [Clostridiales bacterium]|nr:flagellar hook protein FlgE [Clostridiales bacterium]